jgi:hypothetical protein
MDRENIGNNNLPDFKQLNDRLIAEPTSEPFLVIKTNLDSENPSVENPYYQNKTSNEKELNDYFNGK